MSEAVETALTLPEEDVYAEFCNREWCDGLPFVPPTAERVRAMLAGARTKPAESLGMMAPLWRECAVEKLAINAVMAGCEPAYFPVIVAATQALLDPAFNLYGVQATTQPVAPLGVVSGPFARQFGLRTTDTRPALVPLTFDAAAWAPFVPLAGLSLPVGIRSGDGEFLEDLLFTHRGLSGPAVLQVSSFWHPGQPIDVDLAPGADLGATLKAAKGSSRRKVANEWPQHLPARLAEAWLTRHPELAERPIADTRDKDLQQLAASLQAWSLTPSGTEGYKKAEVMAGGVDTRELSSQTMESRKVPGLYFIGEVVDVTGWLGGYNFQWAWASAAACGRALGTAPDA